MPKSLSLKKKTGPPKNQQAITQFFKTSSNVTENITRPVVPELEETSKGLKRKASPTDHKITSVSICSVNFNNHVKKHKTDDHMVSNEDILQESPSKMYNETTEIKSDINNEIVKEKTARSPLSNVDNIPLNVTPKKLKIEKDKGENSPIKPIQHESPEEHSSPFSKTSKKSANVNNITPKKLNYEKDKSQNSPRKCIEYGSPKKLLDQTSSSRKSPKQGTPVTSPEKSQKPIGTPNKNLGHNGTLLTSPMKLQRLNSPIMSPGKFLELNVTPKKGVKQNNTPNKSTRSTKDSATPPPRRSPRLAAKYSTQSPIKTKSPGVKKLQFDDTNIGDMFCDEFDFDSLVEECKEDLDLSVMQRCEIMNITQSTKSKLLRLKDCNEKEATCSVEGIWYDTQLSKGDTVSVIAASNNGQYVINNTDGLLVHNPDHLMSSTSVVAGVYCRRKAVLQDRFRGIDCSNEAMTIGTLVHELVQKALTNKISDPIVLKKEAEILLNDSIHMLYDAGLSMTQALNAISSYIPSLVEFMKLYFGRGVNKILNGVKDQWNGHIDDILDIEENLCCPKLGVKGKIDATLQVTIHEKQGNKSSVVPLELKTGRSSGSAEHRGQVVLYGMMLATLKNDNPATVKDMRGLLLYLKFSILAKVSTRSGLACEMLSYFEWFCYPFWERVEKADLREVSCGYPERRDLIMLRNQLALYLANKNDYNPDNIVDIEDAAHQLRQKLPEPVHNERACKSCPYLTLCSLHLWNTEGPQVSSRHPLVKLRSDAVGHLSPSHIDYFLQWSALVRMEEKGQTVSPLHALWTQSPEDRMRRGVCLCNLKLLSSVKNGDRFLHMFQSTNGVHTDNCGPQVGDYAIVSIDNRPWVAAGIVKQTQNGIVHILLERDLTRRYDKGTMFHIDSYESTSSTMQNLTNLGVLMDDNEQANKLRRMLIDKETPTFEKKLPREVGRLAVKLMKGLNSQQQRAVLRAISANDYMLLQGLPGTGKTQTISVLIQMLVALKQRVLVTAHTHSAVDTVLMRLPGTLNMLRLGSSTRVAPSLKSVCEDTIASGVKSPDELHQLYNSMDVVGVTCLGSSHSLLAKTMFDVCIVDEATQVLQSTVIRPLLASRRFVLVGDPEQLPPVIRSKHARKLGMEESLFARLKDSGGTETLKLQYRMNCVLTELANKVAYGGKLQCATNDVRDATVNINMQDVKSNIVKYPWLEKVCDSTKDNAVIFLDTGSVSTGNTKSCDNKHEAGIVLAVLQALCQGGLNPADIGIMAPYRDQVKLVRESITRMCKNIPEVNTVDQFQGKDKSVIIYSCTRCDGTNDRKIKDGEILNDQRRLAVAVTRAKHKLIAIGDSRTLRKYAPFERLLNACTGLVDCADDLSNISEEFNQYIQ